MKLKYLSPNTVQVTMTKKQFDAMGMAVDSVTSVGDPRSDHAYVDVYRFEDSLRRARAKAAPYVKARTK